MTRLLFVEDDPTIADLITERLVKMGVNVVKHSDWDSALNTFSTLGSFDIVLSDYDLQDPDERTGLELLTVIGNSTHEVGNDPHLILYSGLKCDVPDDIAFFEKSKLLELFIYIESIA